MNHLLIKLLFVAKVYLIVGAVIALVLILMDPKNVRQRVTPVQNPVGRFLIITFTWITGWERKRNRSGYPTRR